MKENDTKTKILDAAEKLYATQGIAGTSLRTIIREAGVNTAAVHYHFGSKEGLIEAVIHRRAAPINELRIKLLEKLEAQYPSGPLPLEPIIEAFIAPLKRMRQDPGGGLQVMPKLMGRVIIEADEKIHDIVRSVFGDVFQRFRSAFMRALPHLSEEEVHWRIHFMIGVMVFAIAVQSAHLDIKQEIEDHSRPDRMIERLVEFISAGMRGKVEETT